MAQRKRKVTSKVAGELMQNMFYGPEPSITQNLGTLLNWYNAVASDDDAIQWLSEYLTVLGRNDDIEKVRQLSSDWIPRTACFLARLALRDFELSDHNYNTIEKQLARSFQYGLKTEKTETVVVRDKPNVQVYIREKASELIGDIEGMVDEGIVSTDWSLFNYLRYHQVSAVVAKRLAAHFEPIAVELLEAFDSNDKQMREGYGRLSPDELERQAIIYRNLADDSQNYANTTKVIKPRKRKPVTTEKLLKHFKFAKKDDQFQLVSIDPAKIPGAAELWIVNLKKNLLTVFRGNGLAIKRSSIVDFDPSNSFSKKIGRKTKDVLEQVINGGKVVRRKLMENSGPIRTNRINNTTILLRVEK